MTRGTSSPPARRGMILLAVMVIIIVAALAASAGMWAVDGRLTSAEGSLKAGQARALAWSGVQAVMAELADQRAAIIEGREPRVTTEWELFKDENGVRGIVRLRAVGEGDARLESESAKLDVNTATPAMLARVPGLDGPSSQAVARARRAGRFLGAAELARVAEVAKMKEAPPASAPDAIEPVTGRGLEGGLTAFSFEPSIQLGVGSDASDLRGKRRVDINLGFTEKLAGEIDRRFGQALGAKVTALVKSATGKVKNRTDLVRQARSAGVEPENLGALLDTFEVNIDPYQPGRVDVNRATAPVLACLPGFNADLAAKAVQVRENLSRDQRVSPTWLETHGVLTAAQFEQAAPWVTTRSFQWRVVVEAGLTAGGDGASESQTMADIRLGSRVVLEAVVDVSSERVRLAYLRDVTMLDAAGHMAAAMADTEPPEEVTEPEVKPAPAAAPRGQPSAAPRPVVGAPQPPPPPVTEVDRRLGRWTSKSGDGK